MRRTPVLALLLVLLVPGGSPASEIGDPPPPLRAALAACVSGPSEDQRFAVFTGSMPAYRGTHRMGMRFELFMRTSASSRWRPVRNREFSRWQRSSVGREGFVYTKRVEHLGQDAEYRATVRFRWLDADGERQRPDRVRRTPACRQPDQRPDLRVESVDVLPGADAASRRYVVTVVNDGVTAAGPFDLRVAAGGEQLRPVAGRPAGERATVEVAGPACRAGARVVAQADPGMAVAEADERDNRAFAACDGG